MKDDFSKICLCILINHISQNVCDRVQCLCLQIKGFARKVNVTNDNDSKDIFALFAK